MRFATILAASAALWALPAHAVTKNVTLVGTLTEQTGPGDPVDFGVGSQITLTASFDSDSLRDWGNTGYQVIGFRKSAPTSEFKITMGGYTWISSDEFLDGQPFYEERDQATSTYIAMGYPMLAFKDGQIAGVIGKLVGPGSTPMLFLGSTSGYGNRDCKPSGCTSYFEPLNLSDTFSFSNQRWYANSYSGPTFNGIWSFNSVPEPATWALMILGIGFAGTGMRRRQGTTSPMFQHPTVPLPVLGGSRAPS